MTDSIASTEELLLHTIAWMAIVLDVPGFDRSKLRLPTVDIEYWQQYQLDVIDAPGVVEQ